METQGNNRRIPDEVISQWQGAVDLLAEATKVPSALIMKMDRPYIEVFLSSATEGNPYERGGREHLNGLYCERVINTRAMLKVPDAPSDEEWKDNPDVELGMISYMGLPLLWPGGEPFGTICVLDSQPNAYSHLFERILGQFRVLVEGDLTLIELNHQLEQRTAEAEARLAEIRSLRSLLPICMKCKKIRDDDGYWHALETYMLENADVTFSHGLCPACAKEYLEEL